LSSYDQIGNMLSKTGVGTYSYPAQSASCTAGALSKPHAATTVNGVAYCYDANGNLLTRGSDSYTWDYENRPLTISTSSGSESYAYDADGERIKVVAGSTSTVYLAGLWEETSAGATKAYYTFNGQVVAMRDSSDPDPVSYLHGDHLGSVSVASGAGASNKGSQRFDPWGKRISGSITQTRKNYTGQYLDTTGLLYYHARYYDPVLGRFVSPDPLIPGAGPSVGAGGGALGRDPRAALEALTVDFHAPGFITALNGENRGNDGQLYRGGPLFPQALNRYSYVLNNPLLYVDPSGHQSLIEYALIAVIVVYAMVAVATTYSVRQAARNSPSTAGEPASPPQPSPGPDDGDTEGSGDKNLLKADTWQEAEKVLGKYLDVEHNTKDFFIEGMTKPRRPDFIARDKGFLAELKLSRSHIGWSDQFGDTALLAREWEVRYDLYIRKGTTVSSSVRKVIESTGGKIIEIFAR
jgi:RHS repeat-associated protein